MLNIGRVFTMVCITILVGNLLSVTTTQDNNYAGETTSMLVNECNVCVFMYDLWAIDVKMPHCNLYA